jgi:hypothetical protein
MREVVYSQSAAERQQKNHLAPTNAKLLRAEPEEHHGNGPQENPEIEPE